MALFVLSAGVYGAGFTD